MQPSAFFAHFHPDCASMSSESYANATLSSSARTINDASNPFLSTCSNSCVSSASSGTSFTPATPHNESTRFCSSEPSNGINVGGGDCSTALVGPVPLSVHSAFCCVFTFKSICSSWCVVDGIALLFVAIPKKSPKGSDDDVVVVGGGGGGDGVCSTFLSAAFATTSSSSSDLPHGPLIPPPLPPPPTPRMASANDPPVISDL
mmetsp:Transcript_10757/g.30556  ORF Transcript_10757/g.30556 Transcript_10757/m.30556 type:complete len:203 (-) Transcript_10757:791-1399(-)